MNRNARFSPAWLPVLLFFTLPCLAHAYILFEAPAPNHVLPAVSVTGHRSELTEALQRITGLPLEISDGYLRVREPQQPELLFASTLMRSTSEPETRWSPTARQLLQGALKSTNVYKVRENSGAALGRVGTDQIIELDFGDLDRITYRDLPRETFDVGMIFFHELVHRHLRLKDPTRDQVRENSQVKGPTVEYVNRIERELGYPERRHYAPIKLRTMRDDEPRYGIYFGSKVDRIEFDGRFSIK